MRKYKTVFTNGMRQLYNGAGDDRMRPLKPGYDSESVQKSLVDEVCSYFGRVFDDDEAERHSLLRGHHPGDDKWLEIMGNDPTINETAQAFSITMHKVRKLLITGGYYNTETYRRIRDLRNEGNSIEEIAEVLDMIPATVRTYLPYERVIYNLEERSVNADRLQRFKKRHGGYKAVNNPEIPGEVEEKAQAEEERYFISLSTGGQGEYLDLMKQFHAIVDKGFITDEEREKLAEIMRRGNSLK